MRQILAADLWPMLTTEDGTTRLNRFQRVLAPKVDRLIESIVLYDRVVIPTQDFLLIPGLINSIGEAAVRDLLASGGVEFLRAKGSVVFAGRDGAVTIAIYDRNGVPKEFAKDLDQLLAWIARDCTGTNDPASFEELLTKATVEVDLADFNEVFRGDSEEDAADPVIQELFGLPASAPADYDVPSNKHILYGGPDLPGEYPVVESYLRLVQTNLEAALAAKRDCEDVSTATDLDQVLIERFARKAPHEVADRLYELADIPDYGGAVRSGVIDLKEILRLRESADGTEFRSWFHKSLESGADIAKAYVDLLRTVDGMDSAKGRILRILGLTAASTAAGTISAGPVGAAAGAAVGAAGGILDAFALPRIRRGGSAKLFLEKLASLKA